jgi:hypothetical protein
MGIGGGTRDIYVPNWIVDQDGSQPFTTTVQLFKYPHQAVNYQFRWEQGVVGKFIWEASIWTDPYYWEPLINCEPVEFEIPSTESSAIVSLPHQWLTVRNVRIRFEPYDGVGLINGVYRLVPT